MKSPLPALVGVIVAVEVLVVTTVDVAVMLLLLEFDVRTSNCYAYVLV
jgi:hypothetical protein